MILLMLFLVFTPVNMYAKSNEIYKNVYGFLMRRLSYSIAEMKVSFCCDEYSFFQLSNLRNCFTYKSGKFAYFMLYLL